MTNQTVRGVRLLWKIAPAITELWHPGAAHSCRPTRNSQARTPPHAGHADTPILWQFLYR